MTNIREFLGNEEFFLFEVDRQKNGFCTVIRYLNSNDVEKTVKDAGISNLSTWIIIRDPIVAT